MLLWRLSHDKKITFCYLLLLAINDHIPCNGFQLAEIFPSLIDLPSLYPNFDGLKISLNTDTSKKLLKYIYPVVFLNCVIDSSSSLKDIPSYSAH